MLLWKKEANWGAGHTGGGGGGGGGGDDDPDGGDNDAVATSRDNILHVHENKVRNAIMTE